MSQSRISICIPSYNNARYLRSCISSALEQSYKNCEVVLVDDCSEDDSFDVATEYGSRIRVLRNADNLGQPANTNKVVRESSGDYIVILHSDDILLPNCAEDLALLLDNHPSAGLAVGERMETDETGCPTKITPFYDHDYFIPGQRQARVFMMTSFLPCQVLFRREIFDRVGGVDIRHVVNLDGLMWFKCALVSDICYTQKEVCVYRRHANSTTFQWNRSIEHMMQYYCTLSEMFRLARGHSYLELHFDKAVERIGELTLRYAEESLYAGNYDVIKQYLALAVAFDPRLERSQQYRALKFSMELDEIKPIEIYSKLKDKVSLKRRRSYAPPDGAERI